VDTKCTQRIFVEGSRRNNSLPKQRFPPTVVRLDDKQLQFHHICGRGPSHTNKS